MLEVQEHFKVKASLTTEEHSLELKIIVKYIQRYGMQIVVIYRGIVQHILAINISKFNILVKEARMQRMLVQQSMLEHTVVH